MALVTLTPQLCNMSDIKYNLAIFLFTGVCSIDNDSEMQSQISSAASACSIQNTIASATFILSGDMFRNKSSKRSRWLRRNRTFKKKLYIYIYFTMWYNLIDNLVPLYLGVPYLDG